MSIETSFELCPGCPRNQVSPEETAQSSDVFAGNRNELAKGVVPTWDAAVALCARKRNTGSCTAVPEGYATYGPNAPDPGAHVPLSVIEGE